MMLAPSLNFDYSLLPLVSRGIKVCNGMLSSLLPKFVGSSRNLVEGSINQETWQRV